MARDFAKSFYRSKEWREAREYALKRDNYLCVKCGAPAEEVHHKEHITALNIGNVKITLNPDNLESLCKPCHFAEHKEDKIKGIKQKHNTVDCGEEYIFDKNGFLVLKDSLP